MARNDHSLRERNLNKSLLSGLLLPCLFAINLTACMPPPLKAPQVNRYQSLIEDGQLKQSRTRIDGASSKVLAVVFSQNTVSSLEYNAMLKERFGTVLGSMTLNHDAIAEDVNVVMSADGLMGALFLPLKSAFREVRIVKSIPEGFEGGADYVGVMDLDLNFVNLDSKLVPSSIIHNDHIADCSINFIDPDLVAGPDVVAKVLYKQETTPKFADANNRDFLFAMKIARTKLIQDFTVKVNAAVSP